MTDEEYDELVRRINATSPNAQLASPSALYASQQQPGPAVAAISSSPAPSMAISGRPQPGAIDVGTDYNAIRAAGLPTPGMQAAATPVSAVLPPPTAESPGTQADLNKAIDLSIQDRNEAYYKSQAKIADAIKTLNDVDATDEAKAKAQEITSVRGPNVEPPFGRKDDGTPITTADLESLLPSGLSDDTRRGALRQLQRNAYVATVTPQLTPQEAELKRYANLDIGPSYRALQDIGLQFPGAPTAPGSTTPLFKPAAPGPAQKIEKAQPVPGQTIDPATGKAVQAPASNIGLTTVRGTEFGEVDNPKYGGYTEAGWNVGAGGANLAGWNTEGAALPFGVLNKYGNPSDSGFISNFNKKYDIQIVDPNTGKVVNAPLVDYGPKASTGAGIDLLGGTRNNLGLGKNFSGNISYRIVPKGSALPDNTTASVQQTQQTVQPGATGQTVTGQTGTGQFIQNPNNPNEVFIQPVDSSKLRDPSVYGKVMSRQELTQWAVAQANDVAAELDRSGVPQTTKEYNANLQKFLEGAMKYKDEKEEPLKPPPTDYQEQFNSLASLTSPTAATGPDGKPISQFNLMMQLHQRLKEAGPGVGGMKTDEAREFDAQRNHLVANVARGLFGQKGNLSEYEQKAADEGIPGFYDSSASAQFKTNNLISASRDKMRQIINMAKAQHFDTSAMETEYRRIFGLDQASQNAAKVQKANATAAQLNKNTPGQQSSSTQVSPLQQQNPQQQQPNQGLNLWGF